MSVDFQNYTDPDAPVSPTDGGPDCQRCGNKRFILDSHGVLIPCPECRVAQKWKVDSLAAFSSLQGRAKNQTFVNFKTTFNGKQDKRLIKALAEAERFAEQPDKRWLVLLGERGSGKSHLCAAAANHLINSGKPALFVTTQELLSSLIQAMDLQRNTEQESFSSRLRVFKTAPVLILDDLGAETATDWSDGVIFEILDHRYRQQLATMIATNLPLLDPDVVEDGFDPRLLSRILDTSLSIVVKNDAPDYRLRPENEKD